MRFSESASDLKQSEMRCASVEPTTLKLFRHAMNASFAWKPINTPFATASDSSRESRRLPVEFTMVV
jgi:hypothetical protein